MTGTRTVAAIAIASGTFGGTVGALATAAVQSQASPQAIAAAVQRVQDSAADRSLRSISGTLGGIKAQLAAPSPVQAEVHSLRNDVYQANYRSALSAYYESSAAFLWLQQICRNTAANGFCQTISEPPGPEPPTSVP
jgi:hypothetical protein